MLFIIIFLVLVSFSGANAVCMDGSMPDSWGQCYYKTSDPDKMLRDRREQNGGCWNKR